MNRLDPVRSEFSGLRRVGWLLGIAGLVLTVAGFLLGDLQQFFRSYLQAYLYWHSLAMGCLAILLVYTLMGGNWGALIRRPLAAGANTLWLMALLFIPIAIGAAYIYPWMAPGALAEEHLHNKAIYLNLPFFLGRSGLYFAIWLVLAALVERGYRDPATFTDPDRRARFQRLGAIGMGLFTLSMTFAAFDWMMSLQPEWYSTIYGLLMVISQALAGMAIGIALLPQLLRLPGLAEAVTSTHIRDLGALLLSTVILWAYIAYSQYLIIWAGNLPHEVNWYLARSSGGWIWLLLAVIALQFILPFLGLLSPNTKRNLRLLGISSAIILAMRLIDNYWHVMPAFYPEGFHIHLLDIGLTLLIGGLWLALFSLNLERSPQPLPNMSHAHQPAVEPEGTHLRG